MMVARKALPLGRRWPLIPEDQDLDGLPARVAFHLARFEISAVDIHRAGLTRRQARDLVQGRASLSHHQLQPIALALNISAFELARDLTYGERREFAFHLASCRNLDAVWANAVALAKAAGFSASELAEHSGIPALRLREAYAGQAPGSLTLDDAEALCPLIGVSSPEALLPHPKLDRTPER